MNILLLGDTSNYHNTLATGLARLGHTVTVASDGTAWMDTRRDIDLSRRDGKVGGLALWARMRWGMRRRLTGYDAVLLSGTHFARLHPARLRSIYDMVRRGNPRVLQTALATDTWYIEECLDPRSPLRYNEWRVGEADTPHRHLNGHIARAWLRDPLRGYCRHLADTCDGAVSALYEYDVSCRRAYPADRVTYGGIPVDTRAVTYRENRVPRDGRMRLFLGYPGHRMVEKGADRLLAAARRLVADYPDRCELDVVSNVPLAEFMTRLERSNVVIDQLYSYTPATTALMAMAMGKTVVSGGEDDYYRFIGENRLRPVVNVEPGDDDAIYETLRRVVLDPDALAQRGRDGRELVERHNAAEVVAARFIAAINAV